MSQSAEIKAAALRLLDRVEQHEARFLTWGFIEAAHTWDELQAAADEVAEASLLDGDELIQFLLDHRLLFDLPGRSNGRAYRTRLAEGVRLFAQMRQLFPGSHWSSGPELVADYRIAVRPRCYPRRHLHVEEVLSQCERVCSLRPVEREALIALLSTGPSPTKLASFQCEATRQLLRTLGGRQEGGMMVCAGTSSGKTLAFYLPTLARVLALADRSVRWTQALAIYPRNELLKDQFTEAFRQVRRLDRLSGHHIGRALLIGAFYGATPESVDEEAIGGPDGRGWPRTSGGFICPMMRCPECEGDLVWHHSDIRRARVVLHCQSPTCDMTVDDRQVLLTRQQMRAAPPDLLFTTTEMLNRHLATPSAARLLGLRQQPDRSPHVMLLDEVHSYGDTHGAHVALLLRRWRAQVRRRVQFVGLSATLADPLGFLSEMTGVPVARLRCVDAGDDLITEGHEYQLLLRWNPISGTQVMSTTIQAAMLAARLLDPSTDGPSQGIFPPKVFLFTDDLDATNRLYHNLQDAEARDSYGRPVERREPLASLRAQSSPEAAERIPMGQNWRVCEDIGHALHSPAERLGIGRTSSQDTGVAADAQVVVATSSLELGYNDPEVGAVMQHKAPLSPASFLQRRGRAGRRRIARPWTIVVLSDYGRDRQAYQTYEELFSPSVGRPRLPVSNRYIIKMQAVYALFDWLAGQEAVQYPVWAALAGPARARHSQQYEAQTHIRNLVDKLLDEQSEREKFADYLRRVLRVDADEVNALLWEPPRALMTAVVPTLYRRLLTRWRCVSVSGDSDALDLTAGSAPLPDFVPPNLFTDLMVPEVAIRAQRHNEQEPEIHYMTICQALATVAPGNATRRFGYQHALASHWVPPPSLAGDEPIPMPVSDFCQQREEVGLVQAREHDGNGCRSMRCVRPVSVEVAQVPSHVKVTSRAFLDWRSQIFTRDQGAEQGIPPSGQISDLIQRVSFFTHNQQSPVCVRRFAVGSDANVRFDDGSEANLLIRFTDPESGGPAAVGFEQAVDGIAFDCHVSRELALSALAGDGIRICRGPYFEHLVTQDPEVRLRANKFQAALLTEIVFAGLLHWCMRERRGLAEAVEALGSEHGQPILEEVAARQLPAIQSLYQDDPGEEGHDEDGFEDSAPRHLRIVAELIRDPEMRKHLAQLAHCLCGEPDSGFVEWVRQRLRATLGGAILQACQGLAGTAGAANLMLDLDEGILPDDSQTATAGLECIWVTETVMGGAGVVEEVQERYSDDPRRFLLLVEGALACTDYESLDEQLNAALAAAGDPGPMADAFARVREADGQGELETAMRALTAALVGAGLRVGPALMRSVNLRVLRPGSSPASDALLCAAIGIWRAEEARLGVEIDQRLFCTVASLGGDLSEVVAAALVGLGNEDRGQGAERVLGAILWPRGAALRRQTLSWYNPYAEAIGTDPKLLRDVLVRSETFISLTDPHWPDRAQAELRSSGTVNLRSSPAQKAALSAAIVRLISEPVELDYLRSYPSLTRLRRDSDGFVASFHLREAML